MLGPDEPAAFTVVNENGASPFFLVADHASNRVPRSLGRLGLPESAFSEHIAFDIGIAELSLEVAERLDAPLVMSNYSRLVMDMNRRHESPTRVVAESDGQRVPGNEGLTPSAMRERTAALFVPYHKAIRRLLHERHARHDELRFVSLHSFTPRMANGDMRPWDVGVLWDQDGGFAHPVIEAFRQNDSLTVGNNEPYSGKDPNGYTVATHAEAAAIANVLLEIRQDHLGDAAGIKRWSGLVCEALQTAYAGLNSSGSSVE